MHVLIPKCARDASQQSTASHYRTLIFSKNTFDGRQTTTKGVQMTINNLMDKRTVERRKKIKQNPNYNWQQGQSLPLLSPDCPRSRGKSQDLRKDHPTPSPFSRILPCVHLLVSSLWFATIPNSDLTTVQSLWMHASQKEEKIEEIFFFMCLFIRGLESHTWPHNSLSRFPYGSPRSFLHSDQSLSPFW